MSKARPTVEPTRLSAPFWAGVAERRLLLQYDPAGERYQFYPRPLSLFSDSGALEWKEASGQGKLIAYTLCHSPAPGFEDEVPYLLGVIQLDEGPRIFARVVNADAAAIKVGVRMRLVWDDSAPQRLYQFEPAR